MNVSPVTTRRRWLVNLGLALAGFVLVPSVLAGAYVVNDLFAGNRAHFEYFGYALLAGTWLAILSAVPVIVFLAMGEILWPRVGLSRLAAVVLAATVADAYLIISQWDQWDEL